MDMCVVPLGENELLIRETPPITIQFHKLIITTKRVIEINSSNTVVWEIKLEDIKNVSNMVLYFTISDYNNIIHTYSAGLYYSTAIVADLKKIMPPNHNEPAISQKINHSTNISNNIVCSNCGFTENNSDALFCSRCGEKLPSNQIKNLICPNCGSHDNEDGSKFCYKCGTSLVLDKSEPESENKAK